jgi:hypothetical protein
MHHAGNGALIYLKPARNGGRVRPDGKKPPRIRRGGFPFVEGSSTNNDHHC